MWLVSVDSCLRRNDGKNIWRRWCVDTSGVAAIEVAMILPVLLVLMLGLVDIGNALMADRKTLTAASIAADLLARAPAVTTAQLDDAWAAAQMAIDPYNRAPFGLDIASIQFQGTGATPVVIWRQTYNMTANSQATSRAAGLGTEGEGVLVVTARYNFTPVFTSTIITGSTMQEVAVTRGRRSSFIARQ